VVPVPMAGQRPAPSEEAGVGAGVAGLGVGVLPVVPLLTTVTPPPLLESPQLASTKAADVIKNTAFMVMITLPCVSTYAVDTGVIRIFAACRSSSHS
jgi:hypothetical protein